MEALTWWTVWSEADALDFGVEKGIYIYLWLARYNYGKCVVYA